MSAVRGHGVPALFLRGKRVTDSNNELLEEVRGRVEVLGFELVDFRPGGSGHRRRVQIRIERADAALGSGVTVDDCANVSRELERWLDESGAVGSNYVLEVSSPGFERPIRWKKHWRRFVGRDVNVKLPRAGRVRAQIVSVGEDTVVLRPAGRGEEVEVEMSDSLGATLAVDWE